MTDPSPEYEIRIGATARKEMRALGPAAAAEIVVAVDQKLRRHPAQRGAPLSGELAGYRRLMVRRWRVVYVVEERRVLVLVLAVGKRAAGDLENIYDRLSGGELERRRAELE